MPGANPVRERPVWIYLIGLCAALVVPILAVASVLLWQFASSEETRLRADVGNTNSQILAALERQLSAEVAILQTLATSPALLRSDYSAFDTQVKAVTQSDLRSADIVLVSAEGARVFDSGAPTAFGKPIIDLTSPQALSVSNIVRGQNFSASYYMLSVPVAGASHMERLIARIPLGRLTTLIYEQHLDPGYFSSVVDAGGAVLARSEGSDLYYGRVLPGAIAARGKDRLEWSGINPQGVHVYGIISRDKLAGWAVTTGIATSVLHGALYRTLLWILALSAAALLMGGVIAVAVTRMLANATRRIADSAVQIVEGRNVSSLLTPVKEANLIGAALKLHPTVFAPKLKSCGLQTARSSAKSKSVLLN